MDWASPRQRQHTEADATVGRCHAPESVGRRHESLNRREQDPKRPYRHDHERKRHTVSTGWVRYVVVTREVIAVMNPQNLHRTEEVQRSMREPAEKPRITTPATI